MTRLALEPRKGPAALYAARPGLHALLLAGSAGAATVLAIKSLRSPTPSGKVAWATLAVVELGVALGLAGVAWGHPEE